MLVHNSCGSWKKTETPRSSSEFEGDFYALMLHSWNHFEKLVDLSVWEQTLEKIAQSFESKYCKVTDTISGLELALEKQTIYLNMTDAYGNIEPLDARAMARNVCKDEDGDLSLDRRAGRYFCRGYLIIAEPGAGKTWMMQVG